MNGIERVQLRTWQLSAERLGAGLFTGIDYPKPSDVADMCAALIDAIDATQDALTERNACDDSEGLAESIALLKDAAKEAADQASKADDRVSEGEQLRYAAEEERDKAVKERDALQRQLDAAEKRLDAYKAREAEREARHVRLGDALRLLADSLRETTP